MNIYPAYISKHNLNHKIKSFFIDSKWREMALSCSKETISIIKRNSFKTKLIFIFSIVSTLLEQKTNLNLVKIYENEGSCSVAMPFEYTKILEFNHYQKSNKIPSII